jgi:Domain of unknown function (DUF1854)
MRPEQLFVDSAGRLNYHSESSEAPLRVTAVRPFPISAPDEGLALVDQQGHEVLWIAQLGDLSQEHQMLVANELAQREFVPVIQALISVSSFITPSTWQVHTDRGPTSFVLGGEEFIRRLSFGALLIADIHGLHYLVQDLKSLDRNSRKLLDRFL